MSSLPRVAPTRRTVLRTAAWTAPAVSIAVAAPAYAMSGSSGEASGSADRNDARVTITASFKNTGVAHTGMYVTISLAGNTIVSLDNAAGWSRDNPTSPKFVCLSGLSGTSSVTLSTSFTMQNSGRYQTVTLSFYDRDSKLMDTLTYSFTHQSKVERVTGS